jgi:hypothetical protein
VSPLRATALVLITVAVMLDARSRPEVLATLETVFLVYAIHGLLLRSPWRAAGVGVLCAALFTTHPLVAVFACFAVAVVLGVLIIERRPLGAILNLLIAMAAGFALTLPLLFMLAANGQVAVWLDGMARAGKITLARTDTGGFLTYYLANRFLPAFLIALIPAGLTVWALLRPSQSSRAAPLRWALLLLVASVGAYLLYRFAFRIPATYYNVTGLLVATCLMVAIAPLSGKQRLATDAVFVVLAVGALAGTLLWTAQALDERALVAPSRTELAAAIGADQAAGRRICSDAAALAALDSPAIARDVAVSLRLAEAPAPPDPAACDVYYGLQSQGAKALAAPISGFMPERQKHQESLWTKAGMRPSHFGFVRWVSGRGE